MLQETPDEELHAALCRIGQHVRSVCVLHRSSSRFRLTEALGYNPLPSFVPVTRNLAKLLNRASALSVILISASNLSELEIVTPHQA
jgi:hypothetical protein